MISPFCLPACMHACVFADLLVCMPISSESDQNIPSSSRVLCVGCHVYGSVKFRN